MSAVRGLYLAFENLLRLVGRDEEVAVEMLEVALDSFFRPGRRPSARRARACKR
ncbi:MAG TPA: hypothetical protein VE713_10890 [Pyrinomonadaceae bacterium]|nr:hypothetical protein [Pyrinomonadaceae bacterium]